MNARIFSSAAAALVAAALSAAAALSSGQVTEINRQVSSAKTPEAPAVVTKLVTSAAKENKQATAVAAFIAAFKSHPATLTTALTAAIQACPAATEKLVETAMNLAPDSSSTKIGRAHV